MSLKKIVMQCPCCRQGGLDQSKFFKIKFDFWKCNLCGFKGDLVSIMEKLRASGKTLEGRFIPVDKRELLP